MDNAFNLNVVMLYYTRFPTGKQDIPLFPTKSERFGIVHKIDNSCTDFSAVVFTLQKSETWRNENEK